jgi:hypothetical protein
MARAEGFRASLLPAVSALDCLFADLEIDLGTHGCQSYDATDFVNRHRTTDPSVPLVLWGLDCAGDSTCVGPNIKTLEALRDRLQTLYGSTHVAVGYRAPVYPGCPAVTNRICVSELVNGNFILTPMIYVPPLGERQGVA